MTHQVFAYNNVVIDLSSGNLTAATTVNAMLLKDTYTFNNEDALTTDINSHEATGSGYARFTGAAVFFIEQVADEIQYRYLTPAIEFAAFTSSNWRYIVIYNSSTDKNLLCIDTGVTNVQAGTGFVYEPGADPYMRLAAP